MKAFGMTNRGAVRNENQDSFRIELSGDGSLLTAVLCDGMGGERAGSIASAIAADTFMFHAANSVDVTSSGGDLRVILKEAVNYANIKVYDRSFADFSCMGMGSTLVGILSNSKRTCVVNVGDSRAYLLSKQRAVQITQDHSLVEQMVVRGQISRSEAQHHPKKNIITRAIGVEASVTADLYDVKLGVDDYLMLCSDGISNLITGEELRLICCNSNGIEHNCEAIMDLALRRGAPDNVTVVLAER